MNTDPRVRVAVVFGGRSAEHAISCISAGSVLAALDRERYDVLPVGIAPDGRWVLAPDDPAALALVGGSLPCVDGSGTAVVLAGDPTAAGLIVGDRGQPPGRLASVDVVFPVLHGTYGEDGTIQGLLELAGLPYVGSGVLSSALAMDKISMKVALAAAGLTVGRYVAVPPRRWEVDRATVRAEIAALGFPVFVKPSRAGSSIGISRVERLEGLDEAIQAAHEHDPRVLVEAAVVGREIECGVLADEAGAPRASLPGEIRVRGAHAFYDFSAKYLDESDLIVPADLPAALIARIQQLACQAFEALTCEGLARVDFFVTDDDDVIVNEVNTMPGFTPVSMFPRMWAASGVPYPELVDRLIRSALARPTGLR